MLHITATAYKSTGKFYDSCAIRQDADIPLHRVHDIAALLRGKIPFLDGGFVVIQDMPDSDGFHNHLFSASELTAACAGRTER